MIEINNETERRYLKILVDACREKNYISVSDFIYATNILENKGFKIKESEIFFYFKKENNTQVFIQSAISEVFNFFTFLSILETNHLIFSYAGKMPPDEFDFKSKNLIESIYLIQRKIVGFDVNIITRYWDKIIIVRNELIDYVNDNFITSEQRRHNQQLSRVKEQLFEAKRQTKMSRRAFCLSLMTLMFTLIYPLLSSTKINPGQLETIVNEIHDRKTSNIFVTKTEEDTINRKKSDEKFLLNE